MPALAQMVQPGKFEVFAVEAAKAVIADLATGEKEEIYL